MSHAVILAGGKGTRLAEVSGGLPKPLVPVAGVPVVERQIRLLARYGVRDVHLTIGYRARAIEEALGDGRRFGVRLHHVTEAEPLGTAGGVAALAEVLREDFLVLYGDVMVHMDLARLLARHRERSGVATLVVHPNDHPADSDLVSTDAEDRIRAFHPKPRPEGGPDLPNLVSAALYVLSPRVFAAIEPDRPQDFVADVFPRLLAAGDPIFAYRTTEYLKDMGTPERLERVSRDVESGLVEALHLDHPRPTLFLDRDGVINREIDGVLEPAGLELLPGVARAIRRANRAGWLVAGVTNQPSIAKGFLSEAGLEAIHMRLGRLLGEGGAWLDGLLHCPHHPEAGFAGERRDLKVACSCRKPAPGMLEALAASLPVDTGRSCLVGDSWRDMAAAHRFGVAAIGVRSGHGLRAEAPAEFAESGRADVVVEDLCEAVALLLDFDPEIESLADRTVEEMSAAGGEAVRLVLLGGLPRAGKSCAAFRLERALRARGVAAERVDLEASLRHPGPEAPAAGLAERYDLDAADRGRRSRVVIVEGVDALRLDDSALRVYVEAPEEAIRRSRELRYYAHCGVDAREAEMRITARAEEDARVREEAETAMVRHRPRPFSTGAANGEERSPRALARPMEASRT